MAEDFQAGNWWKVSRSRGFDGSPAGSSISCSTTVTDVHGGSAGGLFNWSSVEIAEASRPRHCEEIAVAPISTSTSASGSGAGNLMDSGLQLSSFSLSNPSMDWSQTLLMNSGRGESSFQAMLQEDLSSKPWQEPEIDPVESSRIPFKDMNQPFLLESGESSGSISAFPLASSSSSSYGCSSPMLQGLFESENRPQQSFFDNQQMVMNNYQNQFMGYRGVSNEMQEASWNYKVLPHELVKGLSQKQQTTMNQLQFTSNTPFWNASTATTNELLRPTIYCSTVSAPSQPFDLKSSSSSSINVKSSEGAREKKSSSEPAQKKPRLETPSPLPTFKVRKEKLGDRITALQQLVSPFGKTDTASVLHEAIEYIKFLHDQVSVLSTPYLKNGHPMQQQQMSLDKSNDSEGPKQDLRSRGLCLVPISSTYPVASETSADFWTPTFGGAYR